MLKFIAGVLILYTYIGAGASAAGEGKGCLEDASLSDIPSASLVTAPPISKDIEIETVDFIDASKVQKILPSKNYEALLALDIDGVDSEKKFSKLIEKYKGTVTGEIFTKTKEEILHHIRNKLPHQAYYMVCLSDKYRSGDLQDDENQSTESKWLLAAAQQGYMPAISQMGELFTVGNFYFKEDKTTADMLYSLLSDEAARVAAIQTGTRGGTPLQVSAKEDKVHRTQKSMIKYARQQWIWQLYWCYQNVGPHLSLAPPLLQLGFIKLEEQSRGVYTIFFHGNKLLLAESTKGPSPCMFHETTPAEEQTDWRGDLKKRKEKGAHVVKTELFDAIHQKSEQIRMLEDAYVEFKIFEKIFLYAISMETRFLDNLTQTGKGAY